MGGLKTLNFLVQWSGIDSNQVVKPSNVVEERLDLVVDILGIYSAFPRAAAS